MKSIYNSRVLSDAPEHLKFGSFSTDMTGPNGGVHLSAWRTVYFSTPISYSHFMRFVTEAIWEEI